jgi:hypothetical protein
VAEAPFTVALALLLWCGGARGRRLYEAHHQIMLAALLFAHSLLALSYSAWRFCAAAGPVAQHAAWPATLGLALAFAGTVIQYGLPLPPRLALPLAALRAALPLASLAGVTAGGALLWLPTGRLGTALQVGAAGAHAAHALARERRLRREYDAEAGRARQRSAAKRKDE